jgi:hypothetical protein
MLYYLTTIVYVLVCFVLILVMPGMPRVMQRS